MNSPKVASLLAALLLASCADVRGDSGVRDPGSPVFRPSVVLAPAVPRPPILLLHGLAGFSQLGTLEYFAGIPDALRADGWTVFTPAVDPLQSIEVRGAEVAVAIDDALAQTGAARVILIGHSQGGLDARYAISTLGYGDRVATLVTIGTPHHGSKVADLAVGLIPGDAGAASAAVVNALLGGAVGNPQDSAAAILELTQSHTDGMFNPANPDDPRVAYFSYAGSTQPSDDVDTATVDVVEPMLLASWWIETALEVDNDGIVSVTSATWGAFLGTIPADHMNEINQPVAAGAHPAFDGLAFYRRLAAFTENVSATP